jgi:large subunit ribosomal protein L10
MPSEVKEILMKEVVGQFDAHPYAFFTSFDKASVMDLSDFRRGVEKVAKRSLVVKHSMAKIIFEKKKLAGAEKFLKGQIIVTFGTAEPQIISKTIVDLTKKNDKMVPAGVIFENQVYGADFVKRLAQMPSRHELLTQVVVRVKSPITGLVLTLGQLVRGFVVALNEVKKKKEAAAAA